MTKKTKIVLAALLIVLGALGIMLLGGAGYGSVPGAATGRLASALATKKAIDYKIHAFRIGLTTDATRNLFIADPSMPSKIEIAFAMWLIEGGGRAILVDTGFVHKGMIERWRVKDYQSPIAALSNAGIDPDAITDVIVTHGHWDHIGGLSLFGDATVWIPKKVFDGLPAENRLRKWLERAASADRLEITRDITTVAPGVAMVPVGLHAPGCRYVVVNRAGKLWVIASDIAPLYANFKRGVPTGQTSDPEATVDIQKTMLKLVENDLSRIVPGHEPAVFKGKNHIVVTR